MRKNYLLPFICALTALAQTTFAQENKNISIYLSGGNVMTSGKMKDSAFIKNGWNVEAGGYIPLFTARVKSHSNTTNNRMANEYRENDDRVTRVRSHSNTTNNKFSFGIEAGVNYSGQNAGGGAAAYNKAFPYQGGTLNPAFGNGTPRANSSQIFAGPKAEWIFGKVSVAPSVLFGYFSLNRKGYTLSGTVTNPDQSTESKGITFISANDYTASGVVIKPGMELGYHLSHHISLFAKGALSYGPSIKNNITILKPQGDGRENSYSYGQFLKGTEISKTITSKWQSTSINIGLRFTINRMPSRLSMTPTTSRQTQGKTFGEKVAGGLQSGAGALAQGSSLKKNPLHESSGNSGNNPIYESNKINGGNPTANNDSTPTRQEAQDYNSSRSNKANSVITINSGNGSVVIKGTPARQEAQDYNSSRSNKANSVITINNGNGNGASGNDTSKTSISTAQDFNTTRSNRERGQFLNTGNGNNNASGNDTSKTSISTAQDFNTTRNNKDNRLNTHPNSGSNNDSTSLEARKLRTPPTETYNPWDMDDANEATVVNPLYEEKGTSGSNPMFDPAAMAKPGNPIGGIIVKGGKNPGGQMMMITSDNNGEVTLNHLEKGNYLFTLNLPKKLSGKGINEAGIKRNEETKNPLYNGSGTSGSNPMYESNKLTSPGNPIGGIIVKGGKNPGGSFIILTVNNHGQIGFEVLESGNYKLILTAPANTKNPPAKKIKEKTSSGLKDTLKTNV